MNRTEAELARMRRARAMLAARLALAGCLAATPTPAAPAFPCLNPPEIAPTLPGDSPITSDAVLACYAWQEFIALSWPESPTRATEPDRERSASEFGEPGDEALIVWQSFKNTHEVFKNDASRPTAWGERAPPPVACLEVAKSAVHKSLVVLTHAASDNYFAEDDISQAFPRDQPSWLASHDGGLVWYEVRINQAEFDYIVDHELYNADKQTEFIAAGGVINLPHGRLAHGDRAAEVGAIELKAAWMEIDDPVDYRNFKTMRALSYDETKDRCRSVALALVGLHIIHKTESLPQWLWATFEHVDTAPDRLEVERGDLHDRYLFYRPDCRPCAGGDERPADCALRCPTNQPPKCTVAPPPPGAPATSPAGCLPHPIHVVREHPVPNSPQLPLGAINQAVHDRIRAQNADSVWLNYRLVGALWNGAAEDRHGSGVQSAAPLPSSGTRPPAQLIPVANVTMETYAQGMTCLECHREAAVAKTAGSMQPLRAADYSFVFDDARSPPAGPMHVSDRNRPRPESGR